ncbi:hypothetical protein QQS21_002453 [Conoideocrella luteorostrata]|uniref:Uncharacterized protein n=1 Tax=Conoideocrella luteorostrata TaxID=1105319 RepID=A0AAJ0FX93_9HYPO|nr:hypothetical protein QQS21_002453 [Conoideocrella luteorostrata]
MASVRTFAVGQSPLDGSITMAMAVDVNGADSLYVSLGNSCSDLAWLTRPNWTVFPVDGDHEGGNIRIANVMFAETYDEVQYLMVDMDTGRSGHQIVRYHIDVTKEDGKAWVKKDVPIDLMAGRYQSCVGRRLNGRVDGIYTAREVFGAPQLIYQPIINVFGGGPPTVTRLGLPGGELPTAIAAVRNTDPMHDLYETTDLYVVSGSTLYRYPADEQNNDVAGKVVARDDIFLGATKLEAMQVDGVVTLWARNSLSEVFYVSCYVDEVDDPSAWSYPVPILWGIQHMSAYVNRVDGGNSIFAFGSGDFMQLTQATNTESKAWRPQTIKLDNTPKQEIQSFMSYTTTVCLSTEEGEPKPNVLLSFWADSHTPAYINGTYYVLGERAVRIPTDESGSITVVEAATEGIGGSILSVGLPNDTQTTVINPMDGGFEKLSKLDNAASIRQASYAADTVAGGVMDDRQQPLINRDTEDKAVEVLATSMGHFKEAYGKAKPPPTTSKLFYRQSARRVVRRGPGGKTPGSVWNPFTAVGDLFRWLKKSINKIIRVVKDSVTGVIQFIADIAGRVYTATLDAVDAVMDAIIWIYNVVKTVVMAVIRFIQFLFAWKDIKRTKEVLHNVTKTFLKHQIDQIDSARIGFGDAVEAAADHLREWGQVDDWSGLGEAASSPPGHSGGDPSRGHDSGSLLFAKHYKSQVHKLEVMSALPDQVSSETSSLIQILLEAVSAQGEVLSDIYQQLRGLAAEDFARLNVGDVLKRIAAILGSGMLSSVKVVVDALFRVLASLAASALDILDVKLHIPIISDILNWIGIPDMSFLDLFCWIAAVGYTVMYKMINGEAPFPDNSHVKALIDATSWAQIHNLLRGPAAAIDERSSGGSPNESLTAQQKSIHAAGHGVSSFLMFAITFLSSLEALYGESGNPLSTPATIMKIINAGLTAGVSTVAPRYPLEDEIMNVLATGTVVATVASGLAFWGPVQRQLEARNSGFQGTHRK